jgi:uncharacterized protein with PQ loop repeat
MNKIPEKYFEMAGTFFGLVACMSIATQVYAEITTDAPSTLSITYTGGFLIIFIFWSIYGLRFKRPALWVTNSIAVVIQILLLIAIIRK